jgi:hypothetical protein
MPTEWFGICFCDATPVEVCLRLWYCAHAVRFELTSGLFSVSQVAAYAVQEKYPAAMVNKTCQDARFVKSMDQCNWMMPQMIKKVDCVGKIA